MNAIVTTTINKPTEALQKYAEMKNWQLIIVGDLETPHDEMDVFANNYQNVSYVPPDAQIAFFPKLSEVIGWNCIQRRNIGFILAYRDGAELIATIDDDNIPLDNWGENIYIGKKTEVDYIETDLPAMDPLAYADASADYDPINIWHRGYPIQLVNSMGNWKMQHKIITPLVQANLWNGDPDIDAIERICWGSVIEDTIIEVSRPFSSNKPMPFNSQNTILHRSVFPNYFLWPGIGRMDDIWAAYFIQLKYKVPVVFAEATVCQKRNKHNLVKDLKDEMIGYEHSLDFIRDIEHWGKYIPKDSQRAYKLYRKEFK